MDSGSQAAVDGGGGRSGGKILKRRTIAARKTPYDRPTPPLKPENPTWLNALVSPARFVAGGASKLLSSFWNPKSWGSHSSSSESDSDSEGGIEDDFECDENIHDGGAEMNQNKGSSLGKSEILYLVEQLLMLERFSREECDSLTKIINLRVIDYTMREGVDAGPNDPNISNKVIMEARKMITENLVGSSLNDMRTSQVDLPTEALSSLPTIKEKYQIAEEKEFKDDKTGDDVNHAEGQCDMITQYAEVADVINASQGSSNTNNPTSTYKTNRPTVKQAGTRTRKYNPRRGRPRGK